MTKPSGGGTQVPSSFNDFGLHPDILKGLKDLGFTTPTPIQVKAIPAILEGRDLIGCAQTGTGKTAAFLLPILHRLLQKPGRGHVRALVVAPTRELALQSAAHLKGFSKHVHLKGAAIFGGVPMEYQSQALRKGLDIISATPGRLLDHIYSGHINFVDLEVFVLDECDRMLDMGFLPDISRIIDLLPPERQNLVFSATVPGEIRKLLAKIVKDPVTIEIAQETRTVDGVSQAIYPVPRHRKTEALVDLVRDHKMKSILIFTRTKIFADRLSRDLERSGLKVSVIHGDRSQSQRLSALERFRRGRSQVLVATDVAARGIDIENISHVVNYDVPDSPDTYIHRIGRTARAGARGDALTLMSREELPLVEEIEKALKITLPRVHLEKHQQEERDSGTGSSHGHGRGSAHSSQHPRGRSTDRPGGSGRGSGGRSHGASRPRRGHR